MSAFLRVCAGAFTLAALAAAAPSALAEARTTRIETRPFYGATVTLEEGVRVFRPLPRHDRIIVNPEGKTPLSLEFNETRHHHFHQGGASASASAEAGSSAGPGVLGGARDGHGHRSIRRFGDGHRGHGGGSRR